MTHSYADYTESYHLHMHLVMTHSVRELMAVPYGALDAPTLAALNARHRLEHNWPHIAPGLAPAERWQRGLAQWADRQRQLGEAQNDWERRNGYPHGLGIVEHFKPPRPQDVDPMSESEYRALWGDK